MPTHSNPRPGSRSRDAHAAEQIDFRKLYYILRERVWAIALCLLIAGLGTTAYLIRAPRIYAAKLVLQVEQGEQKILNIQRVQQDDPQTLEFMATNLSVLLKELADAEDKSAYVKEFALPDETFTKMMDA